MLTFMRNKFVVLGILGFGLLAIVITGFGTGGMGGLTGGRGGGSESGAALVTIGRDTITDVDVRQRVERLYRQAVRNDASLNREAWIDANFGPIVDGLIAERSMIAFARQQGFVATDDMVVREIVGIPGFQNAAGDFDDATFRLVLQQNQYTEAQLRKDVETGQLVRMLAAPLAGNGPDLTNARGTRCWCTVLPQAIAGEYANLLLERRMGWFGAVPTALLARGINPGDEEVARFYQQNLHLFQLPERRVIRYVLFGREQFGDRVRASDADVQAYYQQHQNEYGARETRNVQLFTAPDEAAARAFADRVNGGASFEDAARPAGFAPEDVNLPNLTKEQVTQRSDANFANLVFAAQQGQLVGPQRTEGGFQVARVTGVTNTAGRALEAVRAEIVTAVETRKLGEQLAAVAERVQAQLDGGASLDEVAQAEHLPVQETPPVTATGAAQNLQPVVQVGFEIGQGDAPQFTPVEPERSAAVVALGRIIAPAASPLAEIRDEVRRRLVNQTALQRARGIADQIVAKINGGMMPADAFRAVAPDLPAPESRTIRRSEVEQAGRLATAPFRLLFTLPERRAHALPAPGGSGWAIVYHQQRTAGNARTDPEGPQILRGAQEGIQRSQEAELQFQFARAAGAALGITRNEEALEALRQSLRTGR